MSDDLNESDLLIDLNSSLSNKSNLLDLKTPALLPPPCNSALNCATNLLINDTNNNDDNNPFDLVISKTLQHESAANDPFEMVLEKATRISNEIKAECKNDVENLIFPFGDNIVNDVDKSKFPSISAETELNLLIKNCANAEMLTNVPGGIDDSFITNIMDITDPTGQAFLNLSNISMQMSLIESQMISACEANSIFQNTSKNKTNKENMSSEKDSSTSTSSLHGRAVSSQSVEEIKAMVAKRVSICIQNALENSKPAVAIPHRRAYSSSSLNLVLPKNSSFANDYCDAPPPKPDVKDLRTELDRIKSSWKNCSYQYPETFNLPKKDTKNTEETLSLFGILPMKPITSALTDLHKSVNILDTNDVLPSKILKSSDLESKKNNSQLPLLQCISDSVFQEAKNLSGYFSKVAESFRELISDEDDLLNCKPQWETCDLELPELSSEENDLRAMTGSWQKSNSGFSLNGAKISTSRSFTSMHESPIREKPKVQSCPSTPMLCNSSNTKTDQAPKAVSEILGVIPPLSDETVRHMTLRSRLSSILNKNPLPNKPELPVAPPIPVKVVDEIGKAELKLRPKRKQNVERKGPMKAVVPLDNMTRPSAAEKKSTGAKVQPGSQQRQPLFCSTPLSSRNSTGMSSRTSPGDSSASMPPTTPGCKPGKISPSPNFGLQIPEKRRYSSPKSGALSATPPTQLPVHRSKSLTDDSQTHISPINGTCNKNSGFWQKMKANISPTLRPLSKHTVSAGRLSKSSSTFPHVDTSTSVITSTPVKNPQIPKFQSSPIYHMSNKEKESRHQNSQDCNDGNLGVNAKPTTNKSPKKKIMATKSHVRSRSLGNIQNRNEKQSPRTAAQTAQVRQSRIPSNVLKPLVMQKPINKTANRMSPAEKSKSSDAPKDWLITKLRKSPAKSVDKENIKPT